MSLTAAISVPISKRRAVSELRPLEINDKIQAMIVMYLSHSEEENVPGLWDVVTVQ